MTGAMRSAYEALGLRAVRPYLIVGDANEAIDFYVEVFDAARATTAGATGDPPSERLPGTRVATLYDPFGLTWWLAQAID